MNNHDLTQRVMRLFAQQLNVEPPTADSDIIEGGWLDSLMLVDLLMHIETQFQLNIALEDLDIEKFRTVEGIAGFIASQQEQADVDAA